MGMSHTEYRPIPMSARQVLQSYTLLRTARFYGTSSVTKIKGLYRHIRSLFRGEIRALFRAEISTLFRVEMRISFMYISSLVFAHTRKFCALVLRSS